MQDNLEEVPQEMMDELEVWQIPLKPELKRFINDLPKAVKDKVHLIYYINKPALENYSCMIGVYSLDGMIVAKTGDYLLRDVNTNDIWVKTFGHTYEVVEDD